jgi:hypothetical protein
VPLNHYFSGIVFALKINSKKNKILPYWAEPEGPTRPGPAWPAGAHRPVVSMADTPPPATPPWRARQGDSRPRPIMAARPSLAPRLALPASRAEPSRATGAASSPAAGALTSSIRCNRHLSSVALHRRRSARARRPVRPPS